MFDPIEKPFEELNMNKHMFTIDFQASSQYTKKFSSDLSFSYITWSLIEQLACGEVNVDDLDDETVQQICFTILPRGQTFQHLLYNQHDTIDAIYKRSLSDPENMWSLKYAIPYLQDYKQNCPI